jgi:putative component of toxin-antitoxin plasmid stabilization module
MLMQGQRFYWVQQQQTLLADLCFFAVAQTQASQFQQ